MSIKDQIRAEIDKRYAEYRAKMKTDDFTYYEGMADALDLFEQYIDTFPEQPEVDLEKEVKKYWNEHALDYRIGRIADLDFLFLCARHFAEWGMNQCPLPEDTTIFMKGVAEGRRLEREEQTEWRPTRLQFKALEVAGSFFASFKDQSETMRMAWDTFHEPLESLGRDLKKML